MRKVIVRNGRCFDVRGWTTGGGVAWVRNGQDGMWQSVGPKAVRWGLHVGDGRLKWRHGFLASSGGWRSVWTRGARRCVAFVRTTTILAVFLLCVPVAGISAVSADSDEVIVVRPKEFIGALRNPLMGFRPEFDNRIFQHHYATLGRCYIKWNEIENDESDGIEKIRSLCDERWKEAEVHNVKIIPRVYLHWSKDTERYWPADMTPGDYTSKQFQDRVQRLIARLGTCWDQDPRVAFVQMGIIGKWGEHHHPDPTPEMQQLLGEAFTRAFPNKKVMVRHPWQFSDFPFGIYWDSFAHINQMNSHGVGIEKISPRWKVAPIGGEVAYDWGDYKKQPGDSPHDTLSDPVHRNYLIDAIRRLHANQLGWIANYDPKQEQVRAGAEEVQRAFGYRFVIDEVRFPASVSPRQPFNVSFIVRNLGSAPMYYRWPVEVAILDPLTKAVLWKDTFKDADPRQWIPGDRWDTRVNGYLDRPEPVLVEGRFTIPALAQGDKILTLAILDPAGNLPSARFSVVNSFKGGRHPLGRIGVDTRPASAVLDSTVFDDPNEDRTLHYLLPALGEQRYK